MKFSEMKGIDEELGEMNIPLKPGAKSVRQRLYRINLKHKEKVEAYIDRTLEVEIIEPVEES
jgi:hypothetical protein